MSTNSSLSSKDSSSWVIQIRSFFKERELEEEEDDDIGNTTNVCVYNVPKSLRAFKPNAYSPHIIALGPYHHWREDLYVMERYKLLCSKRVQKDFMNNLKFEDLVKKLVKKEHQIRGCYNKYLDMDGETIAWMMAIDGLFLLEFLHVYVNKSNDLASSSRISFLLNSMGKKLAYISILNDILMLENQIPIFVLKKILRIQCSSSDLAGNLLPSVLMGACKELSPLAINENYPISEVIKCSHLLDLLYHLIIPRMEQGDEEEISEEAHLSKKPNDEELDFGEDKEVFTKTWAIASKLAAMKKFKDVLISAKPFKLLAKFPLKIISKLPIISALSPVLESLILGSGKNSGKREGGAAEAPCVEQIAIPSVTKLNDAGVQFCPTNGDISTIRFDKKLLKFYLPVVHVDGNTDVLMRNLVAYEASSTSGPLVLARYTELMNGIVDTAKDAGILRKSNIIISRLGSNAEVADLWNGMTKAIRLTKVPFIDTAVEDANAYYNNTLRRKFHKIMKRYVYNSWRILIVLATLLLLGLMVLQSFCSVYNCPRLLNLTDDAITPTPTN
ncbi:putative UPF0481 protein At3g02645 [Chenopodium quinoa]|uniref:Uncharacterized protein n=1 Tax=Chenopodium quinoa TaxID=63459 RepID=A0A803LWZ6_CHEQI|nr:putative UPF0481 protein At3g02645 [Chenopodium quinoa]